MRDQMPVSSGGGGLDALDNEQALGSLWPVRNNAHGRDDAVTLGGR
jgi:hypothetical protein